MIARLVSGGQTGVDRAALDAALKLGVACGGCCPKGRKAEDGPIPNRYPLAETPSSGYSQRTRWNVRDSGGTLILTWGEPTGGTLLTVNECRRAGKPHLVLDLADEGGLDDATASAREWVGATLPGGVLNVAGPRSSRDAAVYGRARSFVLALLGALRGRPRAGSEDDHFGGGKPLTVLTAQRRKDCIRMRWPSNAGPYSCAVDCVTGRTSPLSSTSNRTTRSPGAQTWTARKCVRKLTLGSGSAMPHARASAW
jgi:hypothetical protein